MESIIFKLNSKLNIDLIQHGWRRKEDEGNRGSKRKRKEGKNTRGKRKRRSDAARIAYTSKVARGWRRKRGRKFLKLTFLKLDMLISGVAFFTLNSLTNFRMLPCRFIQRFFGRSTLARIVLWRLCLPKFFTRLVVEKRFSTCNLWIAIRIPPRYKERDINEEIICEKRQRYFVKIDR